MAFQPLLAGPAPDDLSLLRYPVLASPKLDGIRCVKVGGRALTRKLEPVPNQFVREWVERWLPDGIDGELMLRDHRIPFGEVSSAIMSRDGEPDFVFQAFDFYVPETPDLERFDDRLRELAAWARRNSQVYGQATHRLRVVPHERVETAAEMQAVVTRHLDAGYEGTMVRDPQGIYKFGRSTAREGILLKIKPWHDEEATVVGVVEQMHNQNEQERDERGYAKRSKKAEGLLGAGKLGALVCVTEDGVQFEIGTGFTDEQRVELWKPFGEMLEKLGAYTGARDAQGRAIVGEESFPPVKFKHLGRLPGTRAPRGPVFLGWRED